jgi:hypothetical protein
MLSRRAPSVEGPCPELLPPGGPVYLIVGSPILKSPTRYVYRSVCNLVLLFQWHHTVVHEGGVSITRHANGWVFGKPDGQPYDWWVDDQNLARHLDFALRRQRGRHDRLAAVDSFQHPDAQTISPRWAGEPFDLHACVHALHHQTPRTAERA